MSTIRAVISRPERSQAMRIRCVFEGERKKHMVVVGIVGSSFAVPNGYIYPRKAPSLALLPMWSSRYCQSSVGFVVVEREMTSFCHGRHEEGPPNRYDFLDQNCHFLRFEVSWPSECGGSWGLSDPSETVVAVFERRDSSHLSSSSHSSKSTVSKLILEPTSSALIINGIPFPG